MSIVQIKDHFLFWGCKKYSFLTDNNKAHYGFRWQIKLYTRISQLSVPILTDVINMYIYIWRILLKYDSYDKM